MASDLEFIERELKASADVVSAVHGDSAYRAVIAEAAECWIRVLKAGNKIMLAGNGGSAADAQHIAGELVSRFHFDRPGLNAIALSTDTSILTCIGNDYGFDYLFARQIEAIGKAGDVFVAISTSGNSKNILAAIAAAKKAGITVIGLTGKTGGKMRGLCDILLAVPSDVTPRIQEGHLVTYHLLCALVEERLFGHMKKASYGT